ncbi:MAG: O-methyltransferase [Verrucomicrobiota bacterium]
MTIEQWTKVDRYFSDLFLPHDPVLEAAHQASVAAGLPAISVSPNQGKMLQLFARICGAKNILEMGTLGGYSTIWLARALPKGGRLITLEAEAKHVKIARKNIARAKLKEVVEIRVGPALETLPQLASEKRGPFDLIFIDADKENYPGYFEWAMKLSRRGTLIIADNVVRNGDIIDAVSEDMRVQGVRAMNELIAAESRVDATVVQTVGTKGYDGFALVFVKNVRRGRRLSNRRI